ncbi:MAG TPA: aminotransferase class III-fold pyridoxal phosphate-dependent enzyme, partial [Steroidobacteraceae bacterium]
RGCYVTDVDGVERVDFVNNYSALIHGHAHPNVLQALAQQASSLLAVGLPTESEIALAELLCERYPAVDRVRFANSGTEAVMLALHAARAYTGRTKIAKVEGSYHGLYDHAQMSQAPAAGTWGDAAAPKSVTFSPGTPTSSADDVIVLPFNNAQASADILRTHASDLAAVLIDVMPAHLAYLRVSPEFMQVIADFTHQSGALLILDEVYSLRLNYHGAHAEYRLKPDLITMGKIIGGGLPIGAVGGTAEVMRIFEASSGKRMVPHGGTFNANPMSMTAGLAAMRAYNCNAVSELNCLGAKTRALIQDAIAIARIRAQVIGDGSLMAIRFTDRPLGNYRDLVTTPTERTLMEFLHRHLLNSGILAAPQSLFVLSTPMQSREIERLADACLSGFRAIVAGHAGELD